MNDENQEHRQTRDLEVTHPEILRRDEKQKPAEIISLDVDGEGEEPLELDAETALSLLQEAQAERYAERVARHTDSEAIQESLVERQELQAGWALLEQMEQHHAKSPDLSGGDVDAAWEKANVGEEAVGGMAPTPDQDVVEELGEAIGVVYADDEPLQTGDKLAERDRQRWQLDPESSQESA